MRRKSFQYWDYKIYNPKLGRIFYLRHKFNNRSAETTMTVRTHKDGKGKAMTKPVTAVVLGDNTRIQLWQKINKKFPFQFVELRDIPKE